MASGGGLMVSVSGIRGRVAEWLTPDVVARYAAAFGAWSIAQGSSRQVVVGRDSRVSGPMFHRIVVGTLQGLEIVASGLVVLGPFLETQALLHIGFGRIIGGARGATLLGGQQCGDDQY